MMSNSIIILSTYFSKSQCFGSDLKRCIKGRNYIKNISCRHTYPLIIKQSFKRKLQFMSIASSNVADDGVSPAGLGQKDKPDQQTSNPTSSTKYNSKCSLKSSSLCKCKLACHSEMPVSLLFQLFPPLLLQAPLRFCYKFGGCLSSRKSEYYKLRKQSIK